MKRVLTWLLIAVFVGIVAGAFLFLYKKSKQKPVVFETETPAYIDITKKTVATGSIVPRQEVEVKPKISGVLTELYVQPGQRVKQGDPIGKVQIIPDPLGLNRAESDVRTAQIAFDNAKVELDRNEKLFQQGVVAAADLQTFRTQFALRKQDLDNANSTLQLQREGQVRGAGKMSNVVVTATVPGMVTDVPVKVGFSVIQANNFNAGTTVATIADMNDMIFDGNVDESEVGKVKEGLDLKIKIGALEDQVFDGKLEYIAPKGKEIDGAIQFEIKASIARKPDVFIRAGYSANADIVLDERKHVLAIREALVQYDAGKPYVEVETGPQTFTRKPVELGLSDGIHVEVKSGVAAADKLKIPPTAGPATAAGGPGAGGGGGSGGGGGKPGGGGGGGSGGGGSGGGKK
jgi:HlyD family secretion protein